MTSAQGHDTTRNVSPRKIQSAHRALEARAPVASPMASGGVVAGKAGDEALGARLLLRGVLHQIEDARDGGVGVGLGHAHGERAGEVDAARYDLFAGLGVARRRFAGEGGGVHLGVAADHHAIERDALARLHDDLLAGLDVGGVDLHQLAALHDVGELGGDVHHGGDGLARLAHGVALEHLSYLVEQHHGSAFGHVRLGVGEQYEGEGAQRGHRHEEALVQRMASGELLGGFGQHVVAGDEVRHEEQREFGIEGLVAADAFDKAGGLAGQDGEEQGERDDDAVAPALLLGGHGRVSLYEGSTGRGWLGAVR